MEAGKLVCELGESLAKGMRHVGVPGLLVSQWHDAWSLMVVDLTDESTEPNEVVISIVQGMTHARELCRVYGRD